MFHCAVHLGCMQGETLTLSQRKELSKAQVELASASDKAKSLALEVTHVHLTRIQPQSLEAVSSDLQSELVAMVRWTR